MRLQKANHWSLKRHVDVYALVLGSAIGIGNMLTLPLLVKNGGGLTVLLVHFLGISLLGGSLLLAEFLWSRWLLKPFFSSFEAFGSGFKLIPYIAMIAVILIAPPYLLELGKLLALLPKVLLTAGFTDLNRSISHSLLHPFDELPAYFAALAVLAVSLSFLMRGPRYIVTLSKISLLTSAFCLGTVAVAVLKYWGFDGLSHVLDWDFSVINSKLVFETLAFSLFTVTAGFGIMCNFIFYASQPSLLGGNSQPSFWQQRGSLGRIVVIVVLLDFLASVLGVVLLSPFMAHGAASVFDRTTMDAVMFGWLPQILVRLPFGLIYVLALICGLFLAGFAAFLSLCDFALFTFESELKWKRMRSALHVFIMGALLLILTLVPLFSGWMTGLGTNFFLPLSALALSLTVGWKMSFEAQSRIFGKGFLLDPLLRFWRLLIRFFIPGFLLWYLLQRFWHFLSQN